MTRDEKRLAWRHLRTPSFCLIALLALAGVNITLGAWQPFPAVWALELCVTASMVLIVLLVSMEVLKEPPLVRVFSGLGFFWLAVLFSITMVDYLSR